MQTETTGVPLANDGSVRYRRLARRLPRTLAALRNSPEIRLGSSALLPDKPGIYLFTEGGVPRYVGQTRNLRRRLTQHGAAYSRHNQATFAFNLARADAEADRQIDLTRSRKELESDPRFDALFRLARERVRTMGIHFLEVDDPELRTVFEVYASIRLGTENSFETH